MNIDQRVLQADSSKKVGNNNDSPTHGILNRTCSVNLCFCTLGDGIDGSRRCFLEYEDSLYTTYIIILTESEGTERQT